MSVMSLEEENEANRFACELLMPEKMFIESVRNLFPLGVMDFEDDQNIKNLSDEYEVSIQVILMRLKQLKGKLTDPEEMNA